MAANVKQTLPPYHVAYTSPTGTILVVPISGLVFGATYNVNVQCYLDGTLVAGTDDDNIKVFINQMTGTICVPISGAVVSYNFTAVCDNTNPNLITIAVNVTGTVGAVYHVCILLTPVDYQATD